MTSKITVQHKTLYDAGWIRLVSAEDVNSKKSKWIYATRKKEGEAKNSLIPDAVIIVPIHINKNGLKSLVITKEYRYPINDYEWGFPAGLVDKGESVLDAAKRELKEETGYDLICCYLQSPIVISSAGLSDESVVMVYVLCSGEEGQEQLEENENIQTFKYTPKELYKILQEENRAWSCKAWPIIDIIAKTGNFDYIEKD